ncbi:HNH endonuclease [Cytophagaceae bacterium NT2B1]|nr:HNH endonuclease [Xanthocytophaga flavus]
MALVKILPVTYIATMPVKNLSYYIQAFSKLNVNRNKKMTSGVAPHKPVLLLSVIQAFEKGLIGSTHIPITPELIGLFKSNWNLLVKSPDWSPTFALPYYHLKSEPFWELVPNAGYETWIHQVSTRPSLANLNIAVAYASIDEELCELLLNAQGRLALRQTLLQVWFPEAKETVSSSYNYVDTVTHEILEDNAVEYQTRIKQLQLEFDKEEYQEEIFLRGTIFKREIPRLYDFTCCISGLRIDSTLTLSLIDACHIVPFSKSHNDTVTNGIALCPNLHRAFDRGLISLTDQYEVLVSDRFTESSSPYAIRPFVGKRILLPSEEKYLPASENLAWHRENVFQK